MTPPTAAASLASAVELVDQTLSALAAAGSFFTGEERIAIARTARAARGADETGPLETVARTDATRRIAADAASIRPEMVEVWVASGLDRLAYVELISVVVRLVAVDSFVAALGLPLPTFPAPHPGAVVPNIDPRAELTNGWVPTVGRAGAITALSALPAEASGVAEVHGSLYIPYERVTRWDEDPVKAISRPQMELVAARTSWLNDCVH